ncbi:class I histocompatibility antigen, Non-RT1.A alpha-1 chain-like [Rhinoderma darwinii]|uniref:class I histocompatibility antigen, Non-RT1.A alpha-1 chain-like n=1 Tax=Rhinoderma darwinii TaxID=43563 RepID=UPI003F6727B4
MLGRDIEETSAKTGDTMYPILIFQIFLLFSSVLAERHSLAYYFTTIWSSEDQGNPFHQVVGSLDGEQILRYTIDDPVVRPLPEWMKNVEPEHWRELTEIAKHYELRHLTTVRLLNNTQSKTSGQTYQVRFGCDIFEDGATGGYEEFGANGKDFIYLDNIQRKFAPSADEARPLTEKWNRRRGSVKRQFFYKDEACIQWIEKYLSHRNDTFQGRAQPIVKVERLQSNGLTKLRCHAYGFYPQTIDVKWMKNGSDKASSVEKEMTLPNPDGTYQTFLTVEVQPGEEDLYTCVLDHSSLEMLLKEKWRMNHINHTELKNRSYHRMISFAAAVVSTVLLVGLLYACISGRKNRASTEPD